MNIPVFYYVAKQPKAMWAKALLLLVFGIYSYDSKAADLESISIDPKFPIVLPAEDGTSTTVRSLSEAISLYPTDTVTSVHFRRGNLSEDDARLLGKFTRLQYLDLHETQVKDETWKRLGTLKQLSRIGFYNCDLSLAAAQAIRSHPSINTITLDLCNVADGVAGELVASQAVRYLRMTGTPFKANWLRDATWEPKIKELEISHCELCDAHIETIGRLQSLESLSLLYNCLTEDGVKSVSTLRNLRKLSLDQYSPNRGEKPRNCNSTCRIGDPACEVIGTLAELEELSLDGAGISEQGMKSLLKLKKLKKINLMHTAIGDEGVVLLAGLPELRSVHVSYPFRRPSLDRNTFRISYDDKVQITDRSLQALSGLVHLEELCLAETQLGDDGVKALQGLKKLRVLDLTDTKVTSKCFETLQKLTSLETLGLGGVKIDRKDIQELAESLPKCRIEPKP